MQRAAGGEWVAGGFGQVLPHPDAAIGIVIAVDPVQARPEGENGRCQLVQRRVAFHVAEQDNVPGWVLQAGQALLHEIPAAMDVAHEHDAVAIRGHAQ